MNELQIVKAVMKYSIDNSSSDTELFKLLNLNESSFFSSIYLDRSSAENQIRESLKYPNEIFSISGDKGCGKTSISHRILSELEDENHILIIDFKKQIALDQSLFHVKYTSENKKERSELATTKIEYFILNKLKLLTKNTTSDFAIALHAFLNLSQTTENIDYYNDLVNFMFFPEKDELFEEIDINEREKLLRANLKQSNEFKLLWLKYMKKLTLNEYVKYISSERIKKRIIILLDNVDSMESLKDQATLIHYAKRIQSHFGSVVKVVINVRILNPVWKYIYADFETFNSKNLILDYFEFLDESYFEELNIRRRNNFNKREQYQILNLISEKHQKFTLNIIEARIKLILDNIAELKKNYNINESVFKSILDTCQRILTNERIKNSLTNLCNCDRRTTLNKLIEFIEYINNINKLHIKNNYEIESIFNKWLITKSEIIDFEDLNFVEEFSFTSEKNQSLVNHLILNLISNRTDSESIFFSYTVRFEVEQVLSEMYKLGFDKSEVKTTIMSLIKKNDIPIGLLECEDYIALDSDIFDIEKSTVWLTPRARTLKTYSIFTFNFLYSLLIDSKYSYNNKVVKDNFDSSSNESFECMLHFLSNLGQNHITNLKTIFNKMDGNYPDLDRSGIVKYYIDNFGLCTHYNQAKNKLMIQNIITSHIRYINRNKIMSDRDKVFWTSKYNKLKSIFEEDLECLKTNKKLKISNYYQRLNE